MPIRINKPIMAGLAAGLGSIGVMNLDLRPKIDEESLKKLPVGPTTYKKYIKPGDVLVGAQTTPDEAIENYKEEFGKNFREARKNKGFVAALKEAMVTTYPKSITSKVIDPASSHLEYVADPETAVFMGGKKKKISDIIKSKGAHFIIMRRKEDAAEIAKKNVPTDSVFTSGAYNRGSTFKAGLKEFILPKIRKEERDTTEKEEQLEKDIKSGNCATIPAMLVDETVGGKGIKDVLPVDYTRSKNWVPVGYFGIPPSDVKPSGARKLLYHAPEAFIQGGIAGAVGAGTWKLSKTISRLLKKASMDEQIVDEFVKLARKSSFEVLKKNKVPLTEEERTEVMRRKAVWHHGPNGEETSAVWKSVNPNTGKTTFVTHTHRAYNTAPTVKGAIGRYHKLIKGTA